MFINRTTFKALLTIAVASSLMAIGGLTSSAFADTPKSTSQSYLSLPITTGGHSANDVDDSSDDGPPPAVLRNEESSPSMSYGANSEDSDWTTADNNTIPEKYMNGLSDCESSAAADGNLTLVEIMDCFHRVF